MMQKLRNGSLLLIIVLLFTFILFESNSFGQLVQQGNVMMPANQIQTKSTLPSKKVKQKSAKDSTIGGKYLLHSNVISPIDNGRKGRVHEAVTKTNKIKQGNNVVASKPKAVHNTRKMAKSKPVETVTTSKPLPAEPVSKSKSATPGENTGHGVDYVIRQQYFHGEMRNRFPKAMLDSIIKVDKGIMDTIRMVVKKVNDRDSLNYLKTALYNSLNDSAILSSVDYLINPAKDTNMRYAGLSGILRPHCIDGVSHLPMDSVKVSVYRNDSIIATSMTNGDGICRITGLIPGEYDVTFSKDSYTPFSFMRVKINPANVTYIEMPLTEKIKFLFFKLSPQTLGYFIAGVLIVVLILYSLVRRFGGVV